MMRKALLVMLCLLGLGLVAETLPLGGTLELEGSSDIFCLDFSGVVRGTVRVSPLAEEASPKAFLLVDGVRVAEWTSQHPWWDSTGVGDGVHTLMLEGDYVSVSLLVANGYDNIITHEGELDGKENWPSESGHLVADDVLIADQATLTIADEASVFFLDDTRLVLKQGGKLVASGTSEAFRLDVRACPVATGVERVSPVAENGDNGEVLTVDEIEAVGWTSASPQWDSASVADGRHTMAMAGVDASVTVEVLNGAKVAVHGGVLASNETWEADRLHVVRHLVRIPEGVTLTIAKGAAVRFCEDTGFQIDGTLRDNGYIVVEEGEVEVWEYILDAYGNVRITAYNGKEQVVVVPSELDGHPVASIAPGAFGANDTITSVTLPVSVRLPIENVFADCPNLSSVNYTLDGLRMDFGERVAVNMTGGEGREVVVSLGPGWNLVALPDGELFPESRSALQKLDDIFEFDEESHSYLKATDIESGRAYWIFTEKALSIKVMVR